MSLQQVETVSGSTLEVPELSEGAQRFLADILESGGMDVALVTGAKPVPEVIVTAVDVMPVQAEQVIEEAAKHAGGAAIRAAS